MNLRVEPLTREKASIWNAYVSGHPQGTLYHLSGWRDVIREAYGHSSHYLLALRKNFSREPELRPQGPGEAVAGILPLVHMKNLLFGNQLVSIPFFDLGGLLADDSQTEGILLSEAARIGKNLGAGNVELRNIQSLSIIDSDPQWQGIVSTRSHKVRMILELPGSPDELMKSFKSKLRSQIRVPLKEGLRAELGGKELMNPFYEIFVANMRDLGSPVHSRKIMESVFETFNEKCRIVIVYKEKIPLACSLMIGFKDILENPWASSLREYSRLSPNMLLYWTMLEYACTQGYRFFDFGRSTPDEGTYRFKEQWGAAPHPLTWQYVALNGKSTEKDGLEKSKFDLAIKYWKKLPIPLTRILGPRIRKHISL